MSIDHDESKDGHIVRLLNEFQIVFDESKGLFPIDLMAIILPSKKVLLFLLLNHVDTLIIRGPKY